MTHSSMAFGCLLWTFALLIFRTIAYSTLSESTLRSLPDPGSDFDIKTGALLAPILVPRVPGSQGSIDVQRHLVNFIESTLPDWKISFQNSSQKTPTSGDAKLPFVNIIATRNPPWATAGDVGYLTLVAHYDSKLTPEGFIGATDSAAPCAMIIHAARSIDSALTKKWQSMETEELGNGGYLDVEDHQGVQLLLLDGEEAFNLWTDTDSLYGARSLAAEWESTFHTSSSVYKTPLSSISLFVLLDLLGAKSPRIPSYFKTTHWAYQHMAALEARMRSQTLFESSPNHPLRLAEREAKANAKVKKSKGSSVSKFLRKRAEPTFLVDAQKKEDSRWIGGMIEDDHIPFQQRGVEVLHLIPAQFPDVWHTINDDGDHLDIPTVKDWARLTTAFAAEWLDLEGFFGSGSAQKHMEDRREMGKTEL
ncbi:hypothetical protein MMC25_000125 [Agyrium rufum]|nr:hypothetical protein [Agyrium rufum]